MHQIEQEVHPKWKLCWISCHRLVFWDPSLDRMRIIIWTSFFDEKYGVEILMYFTRKLSIYSVIWNWGWIVDEQASRTQKSALTVTSVRSDSEYILSAMLWVLVTLTRKKPTNYFTHRSSHWGKSHSNRVPNIHDTCAFAS